MLSFRQKIFITYVVLFIVFTSVTFPIISHIIRTIAAKTMLDRANEMIERIQSAPNNEAMVRRLKEQKSLIFFRLSIITNEGKVLYDSHSRHLIGPRFSQEYLVDHPEVLEALQKGTGYGEDYSELQEQKFSNFAKRFDFHGKTYVIRIAFPEKYFADLARDCEIAFLILVVAILLLFSAMTWFIIHQLTSPIQQIINAVTPYQEGRQTTIPEIKVSPSIQNGEFGKLALTLNSLSSKIQRHINNLTAERNEKEAILESLVEGVVAVDGNMKVNYANSMAVKLIGKNQEDLLGHNFNVAQQPQSYALLNTCQKEGVPLTISSTIINGPNKVYLDIVAAPLADSKGAILVMQDKSSHYKLLEMRKDFIANASHELKTPITIIRGFAEMLHDNPNLPTSMTEEMTGKIVKNCKRMTDLIKDLLTLSDIENIPLSRLAPCDLSEVIQHCCDTLHDVYHDANFQIHNQQNVDTLITADPSLMELAFMNLIENAAKYSKPPAQVDITIQKLNEKLEITISDKGIGIPKHDLEHIFDRFYTVDKAHSQKMGGSGLGLSIVQNIIHKHFGEISVASELGKGTTFTIVIPSDQSR
jgi:Signal transduction histidine kinase